MTQHINAAAVQLACTTSTARVQLPMSSLNGVEVTNIGTAPVFVACGDVTITASATANRVVQPNWPRIFYRGTTDPSNSYIAGITASGTATLVCVPCASDEYA